MRPKVITVTGVGTSAWIPVDRIPNPTGISLHVVIGGGCTASVEYTPMDVMAGVAAVAFPVTGMTGVVANTAGNIAFPIQAVRLNQTVGAAATTLTILQTETS